LLLGCFAAAPTVIFNKLYVVPKCIECNTKTNHIYEPEFQLPQTQFAALMVPIGLFIFKWSAQPHLNWMGPVIDGEIILFGLVICVNGILPLLLMPTTHLLLVLWRAMVLCVALWSVFSLYLGFKCMRTLVFPGSPRCSRSSVWHLSPCRFCFSTMDIASEPKARLPGRRTINFCVSAFSFG
jgi:hypothetical protein